MHCQESEYLDEHGKCTPCRNCMPGQELSKVSRSRTNLVKVAVPTVPPQDTALLALTSSALVIIVLVLLALSIIYCKRFWKSQCQRVFLRTQNFSGQRAMFPTAAAPGTFLCEEQMSGPCCLGVKNLSPCYRQAEDSVPEMVARSPYGSVLGLHGKAGGAGQEGAQHPPSTCPNPTAESGEQQVDDAQSLVTQISSTAKGLPVAELPRSLVQSLAFLLDPSLNGAKNFGHVALELGVAPQALGRMSGFEQLVAHCAYAGDAVTVPLLAQALQRLQATDGEASDAKAQESRSFVTGYKTMVLVEVFGVRSVQGSLFRGAPWVRGALIFRDAQGNTPEVNSGMNLRREQSAGVGEPGKKKGGLRLEQSAGGVLGEQPLACSWDGDSERASPCLRATPGLGAVSLQDFALSGACGLDMLR
nr:PREDICTED: tumor necrosis factor receptor superfamily member 27 [Opisthocomus hoazin]